MELGLALAMALGVYAMRLIGDLLKQHATWVLIAWMFLWDGVAIYIASLHMEKTAVALGIILGTVFKLPLFIKLCLEQEKRSRN